MNGFTREVDEEVMATVKTLYISNLATTVTDQILMSIFSEFGTVTKVAVVKNPETGVSRGFAFVEFAVWCLL